MSSLSKQKGSSLFRGWYHSQKIEGSGRLGVLPVLFSSERRGSGVRKQHGGQRAKAFSCFPLAEQTFLASVFIRLYVTADFQYSKNQTQIHKSAPNTRVSPPGMILFCRNNVGTEQNKMTHMCSWNDHVYPE